METSNYPPTLAAIAANRDYLDTAEFGRAIKRTGQTIRKNLCIQGHAYGIRPHRVGGRLLWSVAEVAKLLQGGA
ncbi:conserved hypothetical protein [Thiomonas sp. X19]|uniref:hypothetical protein n=1 Tax=Thiomonas sp. X19 TaxID=1050370 RepID=UPI000B6C4899|nr:hypothetical protein [Thiomonas sp. X19]SCC95886.1 conserved hypothetical protein [Thiomonas sp. X19]